jgi:hypothetical protein
MRRVDGMGEDLLNKLTLTAIVIFPSSLLNPLTMDTSKIIVLPVPFA